MKAWLLFRKMVPPTVDVKTTLPPGAGAVWVIVSVKVSTSVTPGLGGAARVVNDPKIALVVGGTSTVVRAWALNWIVAPPWLRVEPPEEPKTPAVE